MAKGIMVVQSGPVSPDDEDEYNDWYTNTHLPDVCAVPGFVGARRFKIRNTGPEADASGPQYLAVYEIEADDLAQATGELSSRAAAGGIPVSKAMQLSPPPVVTLYELIE